MYHARFARYGRTTVLERPLAISSGSVASVKRAAVRAHGVQIEAQEERACVNTKNELRSANQEQQKGLIPLWAQLIVVFDLLARGQERATARGRTPRQRTGSERVVPPLRGASSFCVDTILAKRPVVPQRLRPKPSSLEGPSPYHRAGHNV